MGEVAASIGPLDPASRRPPALLSLAFFLLRIGFCQLHTAYNTFSKGASPDSVHIVPSTTNYN
jgi:hypothetical protein